LNVQSVLSLLLLLGKLTTYKLFNIMVVKSIEERFPDKSVVNFLCPALLTHVLNFSHDPQVFLYEFTNCGRGNGLSRFLFSFEEYDLDDDETVLWELDCHLVGHILTFITPNYDELELMSVSFSSAPLIELYPLYDLYRESDFEGGMTFLSYGCAHTDMSYLVVEAHSDQRPAFGAVVLDPLTNFRSGSRIWAVVTTVLGVEFNFFFSSYDSANGFFTLLKRNSLALPNLNFFCSPEEWLQSEDTLPISRVVNPRKLLAGYLSIPISATLFGILEVTANARGVNSCPHIGGSTLSAMFADLSLELRAMEIGAEDGL